MIRFQRRSLNQDGTFTILGLLVFLGLLIPIFALVSNLSIITNASSQANGLAYNIAFAGVNRGVDSTRTRQSGSVVMFKESLDGSSADANSRSNLQNAYTDITSVTDNMKRASGLSGDNAPAQLTLANTPSSPMTTGYGDGHSDIPYRPIALTSVPFDTVDALAYTRAFNGGRDCDVTAGGAIGFGGNLTVPTCWVDGRQQRAAALAAEGSSQNPGPVAPYTSYASPSQWAHYSSGAESRVQITRKLWFGGNWTDTKIGVAAFGRPCDTNRSSNIFGPGGTSAPGAQCQY